MVSMYGNKAKSLVRKLKREGIVGAEGEISFDLLEVEVDISDKSAVGNLLQEWLGEWMTVNEIYHRNNENSQMPPDFYLGRSEEKDLLEVKTFDHIKSPNFDVANFDAYVRDLRDKAFRLDADYLIMGYTLNNGAIKIDNIWLKKVWEVTCPSNKYALKTQEKQGKIYNIRPYNFKSESKGFRPFENRLGFVNAIKETLAKYGNNETEADEWFKDVTKSYKKFSGSSL
jgi:type II restriction enzyme